MHNAPALNRYGIRQIDALLKALSLPGARNLGSNKRRKIHNIPVFLNDRQALSHAGFKSPIISLREE